MAAKVKSKVETPVTPLEMVPAPTGHLEIDGTNVGAFRAFGKINQKIVAFNAKPQKGLTETYEMIDAAVGWLTAYGGANESELDGLSFAELSEVWQEAGAAYLGSDIPQKKSAS